jgi:ribosomal protein L7/L12
VWRKKDSAEIAALKERVDRLEVQMSSLFRSLGKGPDVSQPSSRVLDLAAGGRKIEAIKTFREETGASLREAKEFVESLIPPKA